MSDIFDIRDNIERFEELEETENRDGDEQEEFDALSAFLGEVRDQGGDHKWRGHWYPGTFNPDASWPNNCIDWERAASELQADYSSVEYNGTTYWFR